MPYTNSILRYPGGKSQLATYIEHLLKINNISGTYIEPFAGGAGVALYLLFHNAIDKIILNDFDPSIFSVWYAILNNKDNFIDMIDKTPVTIQEWNYQKKQHLRYFNDPYSLKNAFATFFLNRTNVSGIINGGPIGGKNQKGKYKINCRFNKKKLIEKINRIHSFRNRIELYNFDAEYFISEKINKSDSRSTFTFFDPPYFNQGKKLYLSFIDKDKHRRIANEIVSLKDKKWITTYDIEKQILRYYEPYSKVYKYQLLYSANKKRRANEYIFASYVTNIDSFDKVKLVSSSN